MRPFFLGLITFSALSTSVGGQSTVAHHPLDALTTQEYWTIHDVLAQSGHLTDKTLFSSVLLHEPAKDPGVGLEGGGYPSSRSRCHSRGWGKDHRGAGGHHGAQAGVLEAGAWGAGAHYGV